MSKHDEGEIDIAIRIAVGFAGATIVVLPAFMSWWDANDPLNASKLAVWSYGVTLVIVWVFSVGITGWEPEKHWLPCLLKSIGLPALLISLGSLSQVVGD